MRHLVKRWLHRLGYDVSTVSYAQDFMPGLHLRRLFQQFRIDCVVDVGANLGQYRDFLRDAVGFEGRIVSFEPVPEHVSILEARAADDPRWTIVGRALGAEPGSLEINVTAGGDLSSFLAPRESSPAMAVEARVAVPVTTLDESLPLIRQNCALSSTYVKIDTQGFDLNVLRGGRATLTEIPALQTEMPLLPIYHEMPSFVEMYEYLKALGFDLSAAFPASRDGFLRSRELDGVFVNSRLLDRREPRGPGRA